MDPRQFIILLNQLSRAVDSHNPSNEIDEADRVAALKEAQKLVRALEKPREAVLKMAYSVSQALSEYT